LGSAPLILAFEDPSCTNCERFNTNTFPELEAKLIDPGKVSYVYRNFPYAFEWGRPAMGALEATYARSEDAFWKLKSHYFVTQSGFGEENVLDRSKEFLASETSVDAGTVIEDAREGAYERAVERDVSAGEAAGVVSTPTFFLFRDGTFLTEIRGAQSYRVFARALGV
jgi:protein-disulfide isomerase